MQAVQEKEFERRKRDSNKLITKLENLINQDKESCYKSLKSFMLDIDKGSYAGGGVKPRFTKESNFILDLTGQLTLNNLVEMSSRNFSHCLHLTHMKLTNNPVIISHLEIFTSVLKKWTRVEIVDINFCGIRNSNDVLSVLDACRKLNHLKVLKMKETRNSEEYQELYARKGSVVDALKKNVSLVYLEFTEELFETRYRPIQRELDINSFNEDIKAQLRSATNSESVPVNLQNIKLCRRFGIKLLLPEKPSGEDLNLVHQYLELPDNKIRILDCSNVDSSNFVNVIKLLNQPTTNYSNLDIVNFGFRTLHPKEFIVFGKWLLKQFSSRKEREFTSIPKYLWKLRTHQIYGKTQPIDENKEEVVLSERNSSLIRREARRFYCRSNTINDKNVDIFKSCDENDKNKIEVVIFVTRKLNADDLKVIWLITNHCNDYLHLTLKAHEFAEKVEYAPIEPNRKSNCCQQLMHVRKNVCSFNYLEDVEQNIKFHVLIKFAYLLFFINLILCILLPIFLKHGECGKGTLWISHILFGVYLVGTFFGEIAMFFIWFDKKTRNLVFWDKRKRRVYFVIFAYTMVGIISKGDIYTDITFLVEVGKWNEQDKGSYGPVILWIASVVFAFNIIYQLCLFIRLFWRSSSSTFGPLASHTTRLLVCADFKFLSVMVDKFSVTYYENFFLWRVPTYKILALFKLIFEDISQCVLQITYLATAREDDLSLYVIIISLWFSFPAIGSSLFTLFYDATSTLKYDDYKMMEKKIKEGCEQNESNIYMNKGNISSPDPSNYYSVSNAGGELKLPSIKKAFQKQGSFDVSVSMSETNNKPLSTYADNENFEKTVNKILLRTPEKPPRPPRRQYESPMVRANFQGEARSNRMIPEIQEKSTFKLYPVRESEMSDSSSSGDGKHLEPLPKISTFKKYFSEWK